MTTVSSCFQAAQLDDECVQIAALCALFDLVLIFGFDCLLECRKQETKKEHEVMSESETSAIGEATEDDSGDVREEAEGQNTADAILAIMSTLLDNDVSLCRDLVECIERCIFQCNNLMC